MKIIRYIKAALIGLAVTSTLVPVAHAETLRVLRGEASSMLNVPINRAVVVEAETPFAELSIANPGIADISTLSDRTIYVLGRAPGRTTLTLLGPEGNLIANVEVSVTPDVAEFKERLGQILPGENIEVRTANDGIVLSGVVSSISRLDRALDLAERYAPGRVSNLLSVGGTQQVMLKVRFVEMERSVSKGLSGGLSTGGSDVSVDGGSAGIALGSDGNNDGIAEFVSGVFTLNPGAIGSVFSTFEIGSVAFAALLEALESKNLIRTLSEPNLVTLSGQEASFLAGGEYPVPVTGEDGAITVEFRPFGVQLTFTPRVLDGGTINLDLNAAVSALDPDTSVTANGIEVLAFSKRETRTVVEMKDGESFAIAGLLQDDFQDINTQVPWIGDIPVLGTLFRSASFQRSQSELVVIITAHLVSPTRSEALALSTDRVRPPTEAELFLFGKTVGARGPQAGAAGEVAKQDFTGSYGYVME